MISKEEIAALAELARLKLKVGEEESLQKDISSILEYVGQINSFTAGPLSMEKPLQRNVLRADMPRLETDPMHHKEASLGKAFPVEEGGYNVVRKIIQKDE